MKIVYNPKILKSSYKAFYGEGGDRLHEIKIVGFPLDLKFDIDYYIKQVHTARYFKKIRGHCKNKIPIAEIIPNLDTLEAIYSSVRLAIYSSENNDFAITLPPGHHASKGSASGFCLINNIAIATQKLVDEGKRVCIVDLDGHHGNGTEKIFYSNDKVLLCSVYQERSFPNIKSPMTRIGKGIGKGFNLSLPIPIGSGDDILLESFKFFKKYITDFNPDIIGLSAGFDGYGKDNLLKLNYSLAGYNKLGLEIRVLGYPSFGVLEGGYHQEVIDCIKSLVNGLNGISIESSLTNSNKEVWEKFKLNTNRLEGKLNEKFS